MTDHWLEVLDEVGSVVEQIPLPQKATVGRGSADLKPDIPVPGDCRSTSRQHAVIENRRDGVILTDSSRYGTVVSGKMVHQASSSLEDGDEILFGLKEDGWRVRFRVAGPTATQPVDPLEMLTVSEKPREVRVGRIIVEERLGDDAFRLLQFLAVNKGKWFPLPHLTDQLWPDPEHGPYGTVYSLSRAKKAINDLLRPYLKGQDAIQSWPHKGYRMKPRLDAEHTNA